MSEPSDMEEIRRIASLMGVQTIMFPDTSNVLNGPLTGKFHMYPEGGVTIPELKLTGSSMGTLALGKLASGPAAKALDTKCKVPCEILDLPIGLHGTDMFVDMLRRIAGVNVPDSLTLERGQLVDVISDMHQYFYGKKVALAGDPDQLLALAKFLVSIDMIPVYMVTGTPAAKNLKTPLREVVKDVPHEVKIKIPGDMFLLHQWIKNEPVDLLIGNTYLKYIAKDEDIPLLRYGFPIFDRIGHSYFPTIGYKGGIRLSGKNIGCAAGSQRPGRYRNQHGTGDVGLNPLCRKDKRKRNDVSIPILKERENHDLAKRRYARIRPDLRQTQPGRFGQPEGLRVLRLPGGACIRLPMRFIWFTDPSDALHIPGISGARCLRVRSFIASVFPRICRKKM